MTTKTKAASASAKAPKPALKKPKATRAKKADPVATAPLPEAPLQQVTPNGSLVDVLLLPQEVRAGGG
jgi:hypothetical protein